MSFPYKHVLLVGATAGIGKAMAHRLVQEGVKVTAVGRRQDRLDEFVTTHGANKTSAERVDIADSNAMPKFAAEYIPISDDTSITSLFQSTIINLAEPAKWDMQAIHNDVSVNFTSFVNLTHAFLPFLLNKRSKTSLIYTTSHLAYIPAAGLSGYSASKAALSSFILCLREEPRNSSIKVIEVSLPVLTFLGELHDYMGPAGRELGMPVSDFTDAAFAGLAAGKDEVLVDDLADAGTAVEKLSQTVGERRSACNGLSKMLRGGKD
ncbi:oxidoreductase [Lophium mytilinum]|uniref:Oxidoreductase n=1 Tax=Lophium mytilinum TaxID=390894 RepID=A0A6A6R4B8_9PEZI|nr:oxidoreductase [Lophium mytilinum]